jgi:hypothetical protein
MIMVITRKRAISTVLAAVTAAALGAGIAQAIPAGAAAAAAPKYVVVTCKREVAHLPPRLVSRPVGWTIFCADPGADRHTFLDNMTWLRWGSHLASGYGYLEENSQPFVRVVATLWGSASVKGHPGDRTYTRITLMFPGKRPTVYKKVNGKRTATHPLTQTIGS